MADKILDAPITDKICDVARSEQFTNLNSEIQGKVIDSLSKNDSSGQEGGLMGKVFGTKKENASMNIAFLICILLTVIGFACLIAGKDYWNVIIPAITTGMGYMFGKGEK